MDRYLPNEKQICLRISKEMYFILKDEAHINRRSMNAQILTMLEYQINLIDKKNKNKN